MKKRILNFSCILFILFGFSEYAYCQSLEENSPNSDFALVYFLRGKGMAGAATAFSAIIDDERVCNLNNRRYSVHHVDPGHHEFLAQFGGKKKKKNAEVAEIEVEAGATYYIQMVMQASFFVNDVSAQEITRNSALRLLKDDRIQIDKNCAKESE